MTDCNINKNFNLHVISIDVQQRGFKTHRSERNLGVGVGSKKDSPDSFLDNFQDLFGSRSEKQVCCDLILLTSLQYFKNSSSLSFLCVDFNIYKSYANFKHVIGFTCK